MPFRVATTLPYTELEVADGNFDTSRETIDRVVIHTMDGTWEGAAARFDNPLEQVSAHYGIRLDGSLIHWLEETYTAYHSGNYAMNQRSIGIEHEDGGNYNGVRPDVLYQNSAKLVHDICTFYNIPIDREHIIKHSEVIATGCPDALDIDRIVREAAALNDPMITITQKELDQIRIDRDTNYNNWQADEQKIKDLQGQIDQDEEDILSLSAQLETATQSEVTPVEIPVPVVTSNGLTNVTITVPSTATPTSDNQAYTVQQPDTTVQPTPLTMPKKQPMRLSDLIVYILLRIKSVLIKYLE